jgi:DNA-3-methyladenine glycosylase I
LDGAEVVLHRCAWTTTELLMAYHDNEWGVPVHDDRTLFEFLVLEGAQAGLRWESILQKRAQYRMAFDHFDARAIAGYNAPKIEQLLANRGIVRNRRKVVATIQNAHAFLTVQREFGSFDAYVWQFVGGRPIQNCWHLLKGATRSRPNQPGRDWEGAAFLHKRNDNYLSIGGCDAHPSW